MDERTRPAIGNVQLLASDHRARATYVSHRSLDARRRLVMLAVAGTGVVALLFIAQQMFGSELLRRASSDHGSIIETLGRESLPPRLLVDQPSPVVNDGSSTTIQLQALVDETGTVIGAKLESALPNRAGLEKAAVDQVFRAKFAPATRGGHVVASWANVLVAFRKSPQPPILVGQLSADGGN